ncbi:hypothetical protein V2G26_019196 [Clonostachys chloroleuca]
MLIFLPVVHHGMGLHAWDVSPKSLSHHLQWLYIVSTIYCPAAFFTKVSLLLLIARVFTVRRGVSTAIYIFISTLFVAYTIIVVLKIIICIPIQVFWNRIVDGKSPIPLTWSMRLPFKQNILICGTKGTKTWYSKRTTSLTNETVETSEPAFPQIDAQLAMLARLDPAVVRDGSLKESLRAVQGDEKDLLQPT